VPRTPVHPATLPRGHTTRDAGWWAVSGAGVAMLAWLVLRAATRAAARNTGDFTHFYHAALAAARGADIYASGTGGYIYPPLLAALFAPVARLSELHAAWLWLGVNTCLTIGAGAVALQFVLRHVAAPGRIARPGPAIALAALALSIGQVRWELELGQTDAVLLFAFAFAMSFSRTRPIATGVLLGFAANVKYLTLAAVPYLLLRRRYKAAAATAISAGLWSLLPAFVVGWSTNLTYLERALAGLAGSVGLAAPAADAGAPNSIAWHRSVSVTSAAARLAGELGLGSAPALALALGAAGVVLAVAWRLYTRAGWSLVDGTRGGPEPGDARFLDAIEWTGVIVAVLAFGPQTTSRHMYLMLVPHVIAAALVLAPPKGVDRRWIVAGIVLFQLGIRLPPGDAGVPTLVDGWRAIGGAGWCLLAMFLMVLRGSLGACAARPRGESVASSA
jgi:hypothetical protein